MPFATRPVRKVALFGAGWLMGVLLVIPSVYGQLPRVRVKVSDTTALPGAQNTVISVFMDNFQDTIAGVNLWLQLDRNDIMEFQTDTATVTDTTYWQCIDWQSSVCMDSMLVPVESSFHWECTLYQDTICIESTLVANDTDYFMYIRDTTVLVGNFDTTGSIVSDWEYFDARSLGIGFDLNIAGLADLPGGDTTEGIPPQQGGILCKILADVFDIPDTLQDRTVNILIQHQTLDHLNFSLPDGSSIGILYDTMPDTNCWVCTLWAGDECLAWEKVSIPPPGGCDSTEIDTNLVPYLDTVNVKLFDGSVEVLGFVCGNIDGDASGAVNIADLTYLVNFLFRGGPAPIPMAAGNVDCSGPEAPNIADLTWLVNFLFRGGPGPCEC